MVKKTGDLQVGDVVESPEFSLGAQHSRFDRDLPIEVGLPGRPRDFTDATDHTRAGARFMVIHTMVEGHVVIQQSPNDYWTRVYAKRLCPDGSFDPNGEVITFTDAAGIDTVACVGRISMTFQPLA